MCGLTRKEAGDLVGVSAVTITGWVSMGYLHPCNAGYPRRFTPTAVRDAQALAHAGTVVPRWRADPVRGGERLRALREGAGLNQQQLARLAGLTHEEISRLEHGVWPPRAVTVRKLSMALNIRPSQFVDDSSLGLELMTVLETAQRLDVSEDRIRGWLKQGVLPSTKVGGQWRIPAIAVVELERSGRLRGASRRLDPRYRG